VRLYERFDFNVIAHEVLIGINIASCGAMRDHLRNEPDLVRIDGGDLGSGLRCDRAAIGDVC
jgi:hypothetical protein